MFERIIAVSRLAWNSVGQRLPGYGLTLPGQSSFVCLMSSCPVHCCFRFNVSLDDEDVERLSRSSGLRPVEFLESEDGAPIALPLAQPFVLGRDDGHCRLLAADLTCGQYLGRPNACRLYPHQVLFVDGRSQRPVHGNLEEMRESLRRVSAGRVPMTLPLLIRHLGCPGFTGPALVEADWLRLLGETASLQYPALDPDVGASNRS